MHSKKKCIPVIFILRALLKVKLADNHEHLRFRYHVTYQETI